MSDVLYLRRCIRVRGEDSPNVKKALRQIAAGREPTNETVLPGVISWEKYRERRRTMPKSRQCVSLDAEWWEGADEKLVPREWAEAAQRYAAEVGANLGGKLRNLPRHMGVDVGAGGDNSSWVVGDRTGVVHVEDFKTPDTNRLFGHTIELMRRWGVDASRVVFDLGGGGQFVAQRMRAAGHNVRATTFGKAPSAETKRAGVVTPFDERRGVKDEADAYFNRRSEMAWDVRLLLERDENLAYVGQDFYSSPGKAEGFGLPAGVTDELVRQLLLIPTDWDAEGKFKLIPKDDPKNPDNPNTLRALCGRSPDVFDAFCLMVFSMTHKPLQMRGGAG